MNEYGMNEFEMVNKADVMRIINAENAVVLNNLKERSTDEVLCAIASQINGLQTIEAEPIRHGRWVEAAKHRDENGTILTDYECSECFAMLKDSDSEQIKDERFCYNCGARMDEPPEEVQE